MWNHLGENAGHAKSPPASHRREKADASLSLGAGPSVRCCFWATGEHVKADARPALLPARRAGQAASMLVDCADRFIAERGGEAATVRCGNANQRHRDGLSQLEQRDADSSTAVARAARAHHGPAATI